MLTAMQAAELVPYQLARTRLEFLAEVRQILKTARVPFRAAVYDPYTGNCLFCGECGRCPGVHTLEEVNAK